MDLFENYNFEQELCVVKENDSYIENFNNIVLSSAVTEDKFTRYIHDSFDLDVKDVVTVKIKFLPQLQKINNYNILLIVGASGSGKTTVLNKLGKISKTSWDISKPLISNFSNLEPKDAALLLSMIGISSVPTWLKPYNVLSNGEKYRADMAKTIYDNEQNKNTQPILIDEYTSVVDRNVAKSMSVSLQKYIRKTGKKIILASCHYDIIDWLQPDYIYDLNNGGTLKKRDCLRQRPNIELQVYRTTADTWERFKNHHYMTTQLNKSAVCFVFTWNNSPVAFDSVITFPNGNLKNAMREHRLVVLPDYQGMGIGCKVSDFMGGIYKSIGKTLYTKTSNPKLGLYRNESLNWQATGKNMSTRTTKEVFSNKKMKGRGTTRFSYCHKYIGAPIFGYENLLYDANKMRICKNNENQLTMFN